jgi:hypothetical protein
LVLLSRFSAHAASAKQGDCPGTFEMDAEVDYESAALPLSYVGAEKRPENTSPESIRQSVGAQERHPRPGFASNVQIVDNFIDNPISGDFFFVDDCSPF